MKIGLWVSIGSLWLAFSSRVEADMATVTFTESGTTLTETSSLLLSPITWDYHVPDASFPYDHWTISTVAGQTSDFGSFLPIRWLESGDNIDFVSGNLAASGYPWPSGVEHPLGDFVMALFYDDSNISHVVLVDFIDQDPSSQGSSPGPDPIPDSLNTCLLGIISMLGLRCVGLRAR